MILRDFHVHTNYSDGAESPETMAERAFSLGMTHLGFADHGYAPYDTDCCIPLEKLDKQRRAVQAVRERYRDSMKVYCGVEQDIFSSQPTAGYDYVIGSVHYLRVEGEYICVDYLPEMLESAAEKYFRGDWYALCAEYFRTVSEVVELTGCDIIGHFDLVSKLNERQHWFDEEDRRYVSAWQSAAERLLDYGRPFEVNTGGMFRGYRSVPYPAPPMIRFLAEHGAVLLLSSDAHSGEALRFGFDEWEQRLRALGGEVVEELSFL